jgi:hypothetical protein
VQVDILMADREKALAASEAAAKADPNAGVPAQMQGPLMLTAGPSGYGMPPTGYSGGYSGYGAPPTGYGAAPTGYAGYGGPTNGIPGPNQPYA